MSLHAGSFFARYPEFDHRPDCNIQDEFERLAKTTTWSKRVTERMRGQCYNIELENHFAALYLDTELARLQHLCVELDVVPMATATQCKKASLVQENA